jgi:hypothetical protein
MRPTSFSEVLSLTAKEIDRCDIARVNLLCAQGLPGADGPDVAACLATLDRWAECVGRYVRDCLDQFHRLPDQYHHHEGFFRFLSMVTLLKHPRGLGISYQPKAIGNFDFSDSRDDLLHGLLTRKLGTCTSLPVLFVAIGRRLGWPMHLAIAKRHVVCQWVNPDGTHLNLEGSCPGGGDTYPDDYYHTWPYALTPQDLASGRFLRPLTGAESLALFLETRGHCLVDNRRFAEAREAYEAAHRFAPQWSDYQGHLYSLRLHEARATGAGHGMTTPLRRQRVTSDAVQGRALFPSISHIPGLTYLPGERNV